MATTRARCSGSPWRRRGRCSHQVPKVKRALDLLHDLGVGYLALGQGSHTLSGGEAQRIKLATELQTGGASTLYVLDEPTTGLHLQRRRAPGEVMQQLVDRGDSLVVIEHHPSVLAAADWIDRARARRRSRRRACRSRPSRADSTQLHAATPSSTQAHAAGSSPATVSARAPDPGTASKPSPPPAVCHRRVASASTARGARTPRVARAICPAAPSSGSAICRPKRA
jgi:ABC-type glutathione transport system ATPase component